MVPPATFTPPSDPATWPTHKELPETDGSIVENFQEHPQGNMLTEALWPRLGELFPDGRFAIGHDSGIYYEYTDPVLDGCKSPDWFLVLGVPPNLDGEFRRSYVMWHEKVSPLAIVEIVSGDGREERDATAHKGKFWAYEKAIRAEFYFIFESKQPSLEAYRLVDNQYVPLTPNAVGRYPIERLGVEVGLWHGNYRGHNMWWTRFWDAAKGKLLPLGEERADAAEGLVDDYRGMLQEQTKRTKAERKRAKDEKRRADDEKRRADDEKRRADDEKRRADDSATTTEKLREKLRAAGIDPDA